MDKHYVDKKVTKRGRVSPPLRDIRHCEEGAFPDEAILCFAHEIASGKEQERPRNDG